VLREILIGFIFGGWIGAKQTAKYTGIFKKDI
jgi:hypothetical protein